MTSPPEWHNCYNWWAYMDTSLSPKSMVYIMVHSCCPFHRFGQIYSDMYPSWWYHIEYFHCPKNFKSSTWWDLEMGNLNMHWSFLMSFYDVIAHFLLALNNILLSGCTMYLFTYWKTSGLLPSFDNYEYSCYKHLCAGFCVVISFQLLWVNTKCVCWIVW